MHYAIRKLKVDYVNDIIYFYMQFFFKNQQKHANIDSIFGGG